MPRQQFRAAPPKQNTRGGAAAITPEQMKQNANMMRKDPAMIRRANPAFKNYTNEQIKQMADQLENLAENPEMLKQVSAMSNEEREQMQKFQNEMQASAAAAGGADKITEDAQIEAMCKLVKTNPGLFKTMMKSNGMFANQTEEQLDAYIEQFKTMDPRSLKTLIAGTSMIQKYRKPFEDIYNRVDKATFGCAKYILGVLVIILLYFILRFVWFAIKFIWFVISSIYALVIGTSAKIPEGIKAPSETFSAPVPDVTDAKGDEFDF